MPILDLTLLQQQPNAFIQKLKADAKHFYNPKESGNYEPENHAVRDITNRPDRWTQYEEPASNRPEETEVITVNKKVAVNRIAFNIQKMIVKRSAAFLTGGGVDLVPAGTLDATGNKLLGLLKDLWTDNKLRFKTGEIARTVQSQQECVELWYINKKGKAQVKIHKPADGFSFYPIWDNEGALAAFGIGWIPTGETYSEVITIWTAAKIERFEKTGDNWRRAEAKINTIGKIPIIYYYQSEVEWADVQDSINRLETLISNVADINDYTASPLLAVSGEVEGFRRKGDTGSMVELSDGAKAEYVASPNSPDTLKMEIDMLLRMIYTGSQTPDISFEAMKGLGQLSGEALKRVFIDAYLKASEKQEGNFGESIQRRVNLLLHIIGKEERQEKEVAKMRIEPVFISFSLNGEEERIAIVMKANGGKPVISHETSISRSGASDDSKAEFAKIQKEAAGNTIPPGNTPPAGEGENQPVTN